jgi:carbonic anhydrase
LKKLIKGLREFKSNYFSSHLELFEQLAQGQNPRVLFITCSDSRIVPNLITQADVGDLFVIRNAGNIIPPYGAANGGEGAAVEYAIQALNIEQIVVCGHSHCGAMKGLLQLNKLQENMPLVYDWLKHAEATRRLVQENYPEFQGEELLEVTIAENVLTQIENLRTYPIVHSRLYQGRLQIYGWIYHLETGEVLAYDPETHAYVAPQSQLAQSQQNKSQPEQGASRFIKTHAPPVSGPYVACELPQSPEPDQKGQSNGARQGNGAHPARDANLVNPLAAPWLSPSQADRIYRGSSSIN